PGGRGAQGNPGLPPLGTAPPPDSPQSNGRGQGQGQTTRTAYACEGAMLDVSCIEGWVIKIIRANYGRLTSNICNPRKVTENLKTDCMSIQSLRVVMDRCDGLIRCGIPASNAIFGDPCNTTRKYLEVEHYCQPVQKPTTSTSTSTTTQATTPLATTKVVTIDTVSESEKPDPETPVTRSPGPGIKTPSPRPSVDPVTGPPVFCKAVIRRYITWPKTRAGLEVRRGCPHNTTPGAHFATWRCGEDGVWKEEPDLSECVSPKVKALKSRLDNGEDPDVIAKDVSEITARPLHGGDLSATSRVMSNIILETESRVKRLPKAEARTLVEDVNQAVVQSSSNILDDSQSEGWRDLPQAKRTQVATSIVVNIESSAYQVAATITTPGVISKADRNIMVEVDVVSRDQKEDIQFPHSSHTGGSVWKRSVDTITLTAKTVIEFNQNGMTKVVFVAYNNLNNYLGSEQQNKDNVSQVVNSKVVSASINARKENLPLKDPVIFTLKHNSDNTSGLDSGNPRCSYFDYESDSVGSWSEDGCRALSTNKTHTVCSCDHLTNFAVLMDVVGVSMARQHVFSLTLITYVGLIISLVCLLLAWLTFVFIKNLQCDRNTIHKNLVFCLFVANLVFIAGITQADKVVLCAIIAAVLHFFFLASFAWMCLEGIQLYVMLIEVFEPDKSRKLYYYLAGYGIPGLVVGISAAVRHQGYGTPEYCWLSVDNGFIWSFVGPIAAVILVNIVMLSIAIYMMCKHANTASQIKTQEKSRMEQARSWIKGAVVLIVLLGLTWSFGFLYVSQHTIAIAYIFTILNTLQGMFIFIFHCIMNEKVQKEYKKVVRRTEWLPDCIRVKYGEHKGLSSTPPQSTSSNNLFNKMLSARRRKKSSTSTLPKSSGPIASKWHYQNMKPNIENQSNGVESVFADSGQGSSAGPLPEKHDVESPPPQIIVDDGIDADLSMIDASIVDSEFVSEYCNANLAVTNEKPPKSKPADKSKIRLSAISDKIDFESEFSDAELFKMTDRKTRDIEEEEEKKPLTSRTESEENLMNKLLEETAPKRQSLHKTISDCGNIQGGTHPCPPGEDLGDSNTDLCRSTPNMKFNPKAVGAQRHLNDSKCQASLPNINLAYEASDNSDEDSLKRLVSKITQYANDDGLITHFHGKAVNRNSNDSSKWYNNNSPSFRPTSSDC
ncbi:unnamed protein product, partial [Owenia fusiformis]